MRFDAGSVPVGYLVFSSATRSVAEIQDLALNRVRPLFATLPGVSAPPPFGGAARTIVVSVDPDRLRAYRMAPEEVIQALNTGNTIVPAGNVRTGDLVRLAPINTVVSNIKDLQSLPIRTGSGPTVFLRDVGTIEDSSDIVTGYAEVNGRRTVYIPVTKRADASTLSVVNEVKANLAQFQSAVPPEIKIDYEFDQSSYVRNSLLSVVREGLLGALLTGLMVLLFLRDWRSALIVVVTIPFALLTAVVALWGSGQTINIMTLGGLALAVGILVDESTVVMENIHSHLGQGRGRAGAVLEASKEVQIPRLIRGIRHGRLLLAVQLPCAGSLHMDSPRPLPRQRKRGTVVTREIAGKARTDSGKVDAKSLARGFVLRGYGACGHRPCWTVSRTRNLPACLLRPTFVALSSPHRQPCGNDRETISRRTALRRKGRRARECNDHFGLCRRTTAELPHQYDLSMDERPARSGLARRAESGLEHPCG